MPFPFATLAAPAVTGLISDKLTPDSGGPDLARSETGDINDRSQVNIAPVGVNLGAIFEPMNAGSPANGGLGAELIGRYFPQQTENGLPIPQQRSAFKVSPLMIAGGVLLALIVSRF